MSKKPKLSMMEASKRILLGMLEMQVPSGRGRQEDRVKARGVMRRFLAVPQALSHLECERLIEEWVRGTAK